eukprot:365738-Chlamydomonas_euryale.AAC.30
MLSISGVMRAGLSLRSNARTSTGGLQAGLPAMKRQANPSAGPRVARSLLAALTLKRLSAETVARRVLDVLLVGGPPARSRTMQPASRFVVPSLAGARLKGTLQNRRQQRQDSGTRAEICLASLTILRSR